jgi:hypothetical protein
MLLRPGSASLFCISTQNAGFQHVVCSRSDLKAEAQRRLKCLSCGSAVPLPCLAGMHKFDLHIEYIGFNSWPFEQIQVIEVVLLLYGYLTNFRCLCL